MNLKETALYLFILTSVGLGQSNYISVFFKIFLFFAFLCYFSKGILKKKKTNINTKYKNIFYKWSAVFVSIYFCSLLWAANGLLGFSLAITVFLNILYCCIVYYIIGNSKRILRNSINCFLIGSIIFYFYLILSTGGQVGREEGTGASILTLGNVAAISSVISFYRTFFERHHKTRYLILLFVYFFLIIITGTRKALFLPILSIALFYYLKTTGSKKIIITLTSIILGYGIILAVLKVPTLYNLIGIRIEGLIAGFSGEGKGVADASTLTRLAFIAYGIELIYDKPLLGYGPDSFIYLYGKSHPGTWIAYSHNNFIEIAVSIGLIGLIIYYWIYYKILCVLWKSYKMYKMLQCLMLFSLLIGIIVIHYGWVAFYSMPNNLILSFLAALAFQELPVKHKQIE